MKYSVIVQPPAWQDIESAYLFIHDQSPGAAGRRGRMYRILFVVRGSEVRILHVRHGARQTMQPDDIEL